MKEKWTSRRVFSKFSKFHAFLIFKLRNALTLHLFIFPHTLNAAVQQEKDFRQSSRIGIDHVSSPPKRAKSRNSRRTWRYFMDHSGVVKTCQNRFWALQWLMFALDGSWVKDKRASRRVFSGRSMMSVFWSANVLFRLPRPRIMHILWISVVKLITYGATRVNHSFN